MTTNKQLVKRISGILIILLGVVFGGTWSSTRFCFGDNMFSAFGLPVWSKGTSGTHYPGIVGIFIVLTGITILNATLSKKARFWTWSITVLLLLIMGFGFAYM